MRDKNSKKKCIKVLGCILGGIAIAEISSKYTVRCVARGLKEWHEAGIIRFFDGDEEIGIEKAVEKVKK